MWFSKIQTSRSCRQMQAWSTAFPRKLERLPCSKRDRVLDLLENPPPANAALRRAAEKHAQRHGLRSSTSRGFAGRSRAPCGTSNRPPIAKPPSGRSCGAPRTFAKPGTPGQGMESLLNADADQLVSDGTWRIGRDGLVCRMLGSSMRNPTRWSIAVGSVRFLTPDVTLGDGRSKQEVGAQVRELWTTITRKPGPDGWRVAALRMMLPARSRSGKASLTTDLPDASRPPA